MVIGMLAAGLLGCTAQEANRRDTPSTENAPAPAAWKASFDLRQAGSDESGDVFGALDDVILVYRVNNSTSAPLKCRQMEGGPRIHFSLSREGAPFADNLEGLMFTQAIVEFELSPGVTTFEGEPAAWEAFAETAPSPGSYVAHAAPRFRCNGLALPELDLPFRLEP